MQDCRALDAQDPLRGLRDLFTLPEGVIYLDGNSLGVLPKAAPERVAQAITEEWGQGLIRSWNSAGWFDLPQRLGDKIAQLVGARPGEVVATDSTSINLYKVLSAALRIAREKRSASQAWWSASAATSRPTCTSRRRCARSAACSCNWWTTSASQPRWTPTVAVLMLTHVNYRTGAMHDMAAVTHAGAPRGRARGVGPGAQRRRRAGGPARRPTPTSPSAAATST